MSIRTCKYCNNKYEDNWNNWISKFCCRNCYRNNVTKYKTDEIIYTYDNRKLEDKTGFEVILATGRITKIYKLNNVSTNGLYQYQVKLNNDKTIYRFEHQISKDLQKMIDTVDKINEVRRIKREANKLIKEINTNGTM